MINTRCLWGAAACLALAAWLQSAPAAQGAVYVKTDTLTLSQPTDWIGGTVPLGTDVGLVDATLSAAKAAGLTLGADLAVGGLVFTNTLKGAATIGAGNTLTLGTFGLDLSTANQNVGLNCGLTLGAPQTWSVASGRTLTVGGAIGGGSGLTKSGAGTLVLLGANSYTGGTVINQGTLQVGNGGMTGTIPASVVVTSGATLTFDRSDSAAAPFVLGGGVSGGGTLNVAAGAVQLNQPAGAGGLAKVQGAAGTTLVLAGDLTSTTYLSNTLNSAGMLVRFAGGAWVLTGDGAYGSNLELDGGLVQTTYRNCYLNVSGQTFTVHGGQWLSQNFYGLRMGSTFGAASGGGNFTGLLDGGLVQVSGSTAELGNNASGCAVAFTLSGGTFATVNQDFNLGSGTTGSTTTLALSNSGKLSVNGTLRGAQGAGARQVLALNGGILVAKVVDATRLSGASAPSVQGTLFNPAGTVAPGDVGVAGVMSITGNYAQNGGTLAMDIGGTGQATAFQAGAGAYDVLVVSGTATLGGTLTVTLNPGFIPLYNETYAILSSSNLVGAFGNVTMGGRLATTGGEGAFLVTTDGRSVFLSQFTPPVWPASPQVTIAPASVTAGQGGATLFTASVTSATAVRYQWRFNGRPISGANGAVLSVYNQPQNAGNYDVVVTNPGGTAVANPVTLTVTPAWSNPAALIYHLDQTPAGGNGAMTDATGHTAGTMLNSTMPAVVVGATANTGSAWDFSAATAFLNVTSNPTIQSLGDCHQTPGLSLSFWVKIPSNVNNARVCGLSGVFDVFLSGGALVCKCGGDLLYWPLFSYTTSALADNAWHHVVFTADFRNTTGACYVDGTPQSTAVINTTLVTNLAPNATAPLNIGASANGDNNWKGAVDEFAIYVKALSAAEVTQLYQNTGIAVNVGTTNYSALLNPAPVVSVGASRTVLWSAGANSVTTTLTAVASDQGGTVTFAWSTRRTPSGASATFGSSTTATPTVTLSAMGTYTLRCTVTDPGGLSDYDEITLTVASNQPPTIGVCQASQNVLSSATTNTVNLSAVVLDDGLPSPPGWVAAQWTQVGGPAPVSFLTPWTANTPVTVPAVAGSYVLRLTVSDGALSATNDLTIAVQTNLAPSVTADAQTHILYWPTNSTTLLGTANDDGNPAGGSLSYAWTQVSGPAPAVFANSNALTTSVTFPFVGMYVFQLAVSDGALTGVATTYVDVWSPGGPLVNAGSSRVTWLPNAVVASQGAYTNATGAVLVAWSCVQGPGNVVFSTGSGLATTATFTNAGKYRLALNVVNAAGFSGQGTLVVEVYDATNNFGYTPATLAAFTNDLGLTYDATDLAWSRIKPPPPPGVHPRILFNPEDLPDIRSRLTNTIAGPIVMGKLRSSAAQVTAPGTAWRVAYDALAAGDITAFNNLYNNQATFVTSLSDECFRVLIDNDLVGGAKAGAALATIAEAMFRSLPGVLPNPPIDWRLLQDSGVVYRDAIGWSYDLVFNFMTPAQQAAVRRALALMIGNEWNLGLDGLPGFSANGSNWIPLTGQTLLVDALAIEGEAGADPNVALRYQALGDRMCSGFVFSDGAIYEGMGKGWIGEQTFWALARRGGMALATPNVRNHIRQFYLHCLETPGYGWTWDEMLGGNKCAAKIDDVVVAKYLFPTDPIVDFIYRNAFGANYTSGLQNWSSGDPMYHPLLQAIGAMDFNTSLTWTQALAQQVSTNAPLTSLFNQRGLLVTRSDWSTNGLRLMFQPRSEPGGHSEGDRNMFNLSALGRIWVPQVNGWANVADFSDIASVPRIDNVGPSTVPGAVLEFGDSANFTYAVGDATDCYSKQFGGSTLVAGFTYNQKLLVPLAQGWANLPWGVLPNWYTSQNTVAYWQDNAPVQRAFRTAGLVRGTTPYVLIVDDLQKDTGPHTYDWRMILPADLAAGFSVSGNDAVFTSTNPAGHLLVRVLSSSATAAFAVASHSGQNALSILVTNVAPDYKILLLPYTNATVPVTTSWSNNVLTVQMADGQKDLVYFNPYADGRTRVHPYRVAGSGVVLAAPTGLTATAGVAQATLRWNPVAGASGYNVRSSLTSGGPYALVATNLAGTNYVQTGLTSGVTYYYVVTALNAYGEGINSAEAGAIPTGAPPVPAGLGANPDDTVVHLAWNPSTGASGYNVKRSTSTGSNYLVVATNWPAATFDDSGLVNGLTYYYVVSAVNTLGESVNSSEVSVVPQAHSAATLVWQGNATGNVWDRQNPANLDWLNSALNVTFWNGDTVTFSDSGYWSTPVNLGGALAPGGVVEVNTGNSYTFSGGGKITGQCGLQKDGTGMLTILTANDYTGTNTINQGTLQVGNGGAVGRLGGTSTVLGTNATLTFNTTASLTNGSLDGAGGTLKNVNATGGVTFYQSPGLHAIGTVSGVSGATVALAGDPSATTVLPNKFSTGGMNLKFLGGNWFLNGDGTIFAGNAEVDGGVLRFTNRNFYFDQNGQTFAMHGGTIYCANTYGLRLGGTFGANNNSGSDFAGTQDGGLISLNSSSLELGNNTASKNVSYALSGGTIATANGINFNLGASSDGTGTTTFSLGGVGKLAVAGTIAGSQSGAKQIFAFNGGTLASSAINATNLRGAAGSANGLLVNAGGTLAPGDLGTPGKTTVTGNYAVTSGAAVLAVDLGGATQATAFTNALNNYDYVSISGVATLNGGLSVSFINGFSNSVTAGNTFTILSAAVGLTGTFANLGANGRVCATGDPTRSFRVTLTSNAPGSVVLGNYGLLRAGFLASPTNGPAPLTVSFTDTSATTGSITNRFWDFGDGVTTNTTATNLTHVFGAPGTKWVTLTVGGNFGTNAASQTILVSPASPPQFNSVVVAGTNLVISGASSTPGAAYYVLVSTNLAAALVQWTVAATNQFGVDGSFRFTNALGAAAGGQFYALRRAP